MIREKLETLIRGALLELGINFENVLLDHPTEISHGDYSTNVAMIVAKELGKNPKELAEEIAKEIVRKGDENIEDVEVAGPGFINFFLSKSFYKKTLESIIDSKNTFGRNNSLKGKKVMVEYTDPNPFKAFHIGHLMSNTVGESISRLIEFSGAEVKRANYQGDVGMHVAYALWGAKYILKDSYPKREDPLERKVKYWGNAYKLGRGAYDPSNLSGKLKKGPTKEDLIRQVEDINKKVYEGSDKELNRMYEDGKEATLTYFEEIYKILGTKFDFYFFESGTAWEGAEIIKRNVGKVFQESEGAIIFKGEEFDKKLHTRVFINSQGLPTYEAKEFGLAYAKREKFDFDKSITITANEIDTYFEVVKTALSQIDKELASKIQHISHGVMKLPTGKMSSRTGDVITAEELIDQVKSAVLEIETDREIKDKEKNAELIAIAALKYMILRQATKKDIVYDLERSLSFEGDSGPYLQYSFTRANSILKRVGNRAINISENSKDITEFEKMLYRFPEIVSEASEKLEPHHVTTYLTELCGAFNSFYAQEKIIDGENEEYNLALLHAFRSILGSGLSILGIRAPERM